LNAQKLRSADELGHVIGVLQTSVSGRPRTGKTCVVWRRWRHAWTGVAFRAETSCSVDRSLPPEPQRPAHDYECTLYSVQCTKQQLIRLLVAT